jgi:hypothetical protein
MDEVNQYSVSSDANGKPLEGGRNYKLYLPPDIPACNFWSVIVYDNKAGLMIHTDQLWPSVHSNCKELIINQDDSVDIWFGPKTPPGKESNWIQTIRRKNWHMILRLYNPVESSFDMTWKPGKLEEVK